jgi:hypothetical protein
MPGQTFGKKFIGFVICMKLQLSATDKSSSVRRRRVAKSDSMHFYYECTGNRLSTFVELFDALHVDVFLPVSDRIIIEIYRHFSTQSLAIMCSLQFLLCPTSDKFFKLASLTPFSSH